MADLDYVYLVGRLGLVVGDGADSGEDPDTDWCDEGTVNFTPLITYTKVVDGVPTGWTGGNSVIPTEVSDDGAITRNAVPRVKLVDLTTDKINPKISSGKATHTVEFVNVKANGTRVAFAKQDIRIAADTAEPLSTAAAAFYGLPAGTMVCDLAKLLPVPTGNGTPIVVGPTGTGIESLEVDGTDLVYELTDGTTAIAGTLPVGPGGTPEGIALAINDADGPAGVAVTAKVQEGIDAADVVTEQTVGDLVTAGIQGPEARRSWVVGERRFVPERGWFNVNPTTLAKWIKARQRMLSGTGQAHIAVLGDSTWHGSSVNPSYQNATPGQLKAMLMSMLGVPSAGTGIVVPWNTYAQTGDATWSNPIEPRLQFKRTVASGNVDWPSGLGLYTTGAVRVSDTGAQGNMVGFTPTDDAGAPLVYDELWVYSAETGSQSVIVDYTTFDPMTGTPNAFYSIRKDAADTTTAPAYGTAVTPLSGYQRDATGATGGQRVAKISLANAVHNFRFMDDLNTGTGNSVYFGYDARKSTVAGLRVSNLAQSGRALENLWQNGNDANGLAGYVLGTDMVKAALTIIGLMINDDKDGVSAATYKERLRQTVRRARSTAAQGTSTQGTGAGGDVIIVCSAQPDYTNWPPGDPRATFPNFLTAAYEVADEENVALIDTAYRWVDYATSSVFMSDAVHPTKAGQKDIAASIAAALTSF
jgi:lysophospholipase L1-like esterase